MPPREALEQFLRSELDARGHHNDPDVARLIHAIEARHGQQVAAVLLYGSYLRGKRDTLLDFYVLLDDLRPALPPLQALGNRLLPPNVYHLSLPPEPQHASDVAAAEAGATPTAEGGPLRAKYATMTLAQFTTAMEGFHSYFWSRFTQPTGLAAVRDPATAALVASAMARAVHTFVSRAAPMLKGPFSAAELWQRALELTYACELRAESDAGIGGVYRHHAGHFDALLAAYVRSPDASVRTLGGDRYESVSRVPAGRVRFGWGVRRVQGKVLSVLRLVKAACTFNDPLDYLLWKIERHSGIYIAPTERQRRYPLIFAWGLLWRLYRRGAFR